MNFSNEILKELKESAPSLVQIDRTEPYKVPSFYFSSFINRLKIRLSSLVKIHTEPDGYFKTFPSRILNRIKEIEADREDEIPEILIGLKTKQVYSVPPDYFKGLSIPIQKKQTAVIRHMHSSRAIWKQAAAAVITGVIGINALWIFNQNNDQHITINDDPAVSGYIQASKEFKSEDQINEGIAKLSNEDIVKYLSSHGSEADKENLISNISEKDLPPQDISDDQKAIDNYLNN